MTANGEGGIGGIVSPLVKVGIAVVRGDHAGDDTGGDLVMRSGGEPGDQPLAFTPPTPPNDRLEPYDVKPRR